MKKKVLFSLKSPYREQLDIVGFKFGHGKKSLAIVGAMRGNEVQQMYVCSRMVQELKKLESKGRIAEDTEILVVPCVNYYSMNIGKRFWAMDNTDINRMFPGYNLGETTQRIADGLFSKLRGYEYGIQLASFYQPGISSRAVYAGIPAAGICSCRRQYCRTGSGRNRYCPGR